MLQNSYCRHNKCTAAGPEVWNALQMSMTPAFGLLQTPQLSGQLPADLFVSAKTPSAGEPPGAGDAAAVILRGGHADSSQRDVGTAALGPAVRNPPAGAVGAQAGHRQSRADDAHQAAGELGALCRM